MPESGSLIILIDDECVMCNWIVHFIYRYDREGVFKFAGLKSAAGKKYCEKYSIPPSIPESVILLEVEEYSTASLAVERIFKKLPGWVWLGKILSFFPRKFSDRIYRVIARNRYGLFGKLKSCKIIPGLEKKFLQ
jgi:predicted DCC family thiol-disulfide oxidoreductase YuxK